MLREELSKEQTDDYTLSPIKDIRSEAMRIEVTESADQNIINSNLYTSPVAL